MGQGGRDGTRRNTVGMAQDVAWGKKGRHLELCDGAIAERIEQFGSAIVTDLVYLELQHLSRGMQHLSVGLQCG